MIFYIKKIPKHIIGGVLVLLIIFISIKIKTNSLEQNAVIDTCIARPDITSKYTEFEFNIENIKYKYVTDIDRPNFIEGEKYLIEYDSLYPNNNLVLFTNPVFSNFELTDTVEGVVIKKFWDDYIFEYSVDSIKYKKKGYYNKSMSKKMKVDTPYKVVYWIKNPKRSILLYPR